MTWLLVIWLAEVSVSMVEKKSLAALNTMVVSLACVLMKSRERTVRMANRALVVIRQAFFCFLQSYREKSVWLTAFAKFLMPGREKHHEKDACRRKMAVILPCPRWGGYGFFEILLLQKWRTSAMPKQEAMAYHYRRKTTKRRIACL